MEAKPPPPDWSDRPGSPGAARPGLDPDVLQLLAEEATVERQTVETGRVRVATVTHTRDHLIDELLARTSVEVKRVPIGRIIDAIPPVTDDADLTVIPIVEETLVVERRLVLKEEVHIKRRKTTERYQETVQLRHQTAEVTHIPTRQTGLGQAGTDSIVETERKPEDT
jgi:uncharacterized protein (TIGR02271 family)